MGNKAGLFDHWLKHFTLTVFMQSFHAIFFVFILKVFAAVNNLGTEMDAFDSRQGIIAVIMIAASTALIKFEKLVKQFFGIGESIAGDFKTSAAKTFMALQAGQRLVSKTAEPFKQSIRAKKRVDALGNSPLLGLKSEEKGKFVPTTYEQAQARKNQNVGDTPTGTQVGATAGAEKPDTSKMNNAEYNNYLAGAAADYAKSAGIVIGDRVAATSTKATAEDGGSDAAKELRIDRDERMKEKYYSKLDEYNDAVRDYENNKLQKWLNLGGAVASMGMATGMTDQFEESIVAGELINRPIDAVGSRLAERRANKLAYKELGHEGSEMFDKQKSKYYEKNIKENLQSAFEAYANAATVGIYSAAKDASVRRADRRRREAPPNRGADINDI